MKTSPHIIIPEDLLQAATADGKPQVLLHACCAPCSSAIVEWLLAHGIEPVIYYFNPNIYPQAEYEIRKNESAETPCSSNMRSTISSTAAANSACAMQNRWRLCPGSISVLCKPKRGSIC